VDFRFFNRLRVEPGEVTSLPKYDLLISGFTTADRVLVPFKSFPAKRKLWMLFPEYQIPSDKIPVDAVELQGEDEAACIVEFCAKSGLTVVDRRLRICVDCTAIIRPYFLFLMAWFERQGFSVVHVFYSEPDWYADLEDTVFSAKESSSIDVRPVMGFEGVPSQELTKHLILGGGYETKLLSQVAYTKEFARKYLLLGFPSNRPEMYQESVLCAHAAREAIGGVPEGRYWSSCAANDPFAVANALCKIEVAETISPNCNLYLAPVGTKPQTLGFFIYYLARRTALSLTILYPFSKTYSTDIAIGYTRSWIYEIEFEEIQNALESS